MAGTAVYLEWGTAIPRYVPFLTDMRYDVDR
jgi:hypothetical protein